MEFSGQYLTYSEYQTLGGTTLDQTSFNLLEFEARRNIDIRTQNRLTVVDHEDIPEEVKLCEYKIINTIEEYAKIESNYDVNPNIQSESTDGYTIQYLTFDRIKSITGTKLSEIESTIDEYLTYVVVNNEHIIYNGVK